LAAREAFDGNGLNYLWFRVPLQILFIVWVYFSLIIFYSYLKKAMFNKISFKIATNAILII
jgi:hypothetical protein